MQEAVITLVQIPKWLQYVKKLGCDYFGCLSDYLSITHNNITGQKLWIVGL